MRRAVQCHSLNFVRVRHAPSTLHVATMYTQQSISLAIRRGDGILARISWHSTHLDVHHDITNDVSRHEVSGREEDDDEGSEAERKIRRIA